MTIQDLSEILIGLALVGWIAYRQLTWQVVSVSRMWRMPVILGLIGVVSLAQMKGAQPLKPVDVGVLVIELVISAAIGMVMGRLAVFRTRTFRPGEAGDPPTRRRGDRRAQSHVDRTLNADGSETVLENRTGWLGLALWIALILVRIGMDVVATELGATLVTTTGVILIMIAANRAARVLVLAARVQKSHVLTA